MTWATWQTSLPALFGALLGSQSEPVPCDWADQPRTMHVRSRAQLTVISMGAVGVEDMRRHEGAAGVLLEEAIGQRTMALQVDVWSPRQTLAEDAKVLIERLRTRLAMTSTQDALRALRLSLQDVRDPVRLDAIEDARKVSRWSMDVVLGYAWSERDEDNVGTWIDDARITSATTAGDMIEDVDGTPLPAGLQLDINPPEGG